MLFCPATDSVVCIPVTIYCVVPENKLCVVRGECGVNVYFVCGRVKKREIALRLINVARRVSHNELDRIKQMPHRTHELSLLSSDNRFWPNNSFLFLLYRLVQVYTQMFSLIYSLLTFPGRNLLF